MEHFPLVDRLHTDVLEDKYGEISVRVLRHDDEVREAHLVDSNGISRTYALTFFSSGSLSDEVVTIDSEIRAGEAIGKAFRKKGYSIRKNVLEVYTLELPKWLKDAFDDDSGFAKARISEFIAKKKGLEPVVYGTVVEVYSPDFRPPTVNHFDVEQIGASVAAFGKVGVSIEEIWGRLGRDDGYHDISERYESARRLSLPLVFDLKRKIQEYVEGKS